MPLTLVWRPDDRHGYVEFSVPWDDPRIVQRLHGEEDIPMARHWNLSFLGSIGPQEFVAVHLPWHVEVRHLRYGGQVDDVLAGKYDHLAGPGGGNVGRAIEFIKRHGR